MHKNNSHIHRWEEMIEKRRKNYLERAVKSSAGREIFQDASQSVYHRASRKKSLSMMSLTSVVHNNANQVLLASLMATVSSSSHFPWEEEGRERRKEGRKEQDKARGSIIGQFRVHYRCWSSLLIYIELINSVHREIRTLVTNFRLHGGHK